jgi:ribonuclease P protein component
MGGPAALSCLSVLKKRAEFLAAAKGRRAPVDGFLLQARKRDADEPVTGIRIGFTCSKKVGNAVTRNRAKRRLRALAHEVLRHHGQDGWDYVLIGKPGVTTERPFDALKSDLLKALARVHG